MIIVIYQQSLIDKRQSSILQNHKMSFNSNSTYLRFPHRNLKLPLHVLKSLWYNLKGDNLTFWVEKWLEAFHTQFTIFMNASGAFGCLSEKCKRVEISLAHSQRRQAARASLFLFNLHSVHEKSPTHETRCGKLTFPNSRYSRTCWRLSKSLKTISPI